jgi:CHAT domain-containing protein
MPTSPVEMLPGGLLDRLATSGDPTSPLTAVARLCAAGAYASAVRAVATADPSARSSAAGVAWHRFAWHCCWLGLPDGTAQPMGAIGMRLLDLPHPPPDDTGIGGEAWIVGRLLPEIRDARAIFVLGLVTHQGIGPVDGLLAGELAAAEQAWTAAADRPDLRPHLHLLMAEAAARSGDDTTMGQHLNAARQTMEAAGDDLGLAAAAVVAGDLSAAPLTSPVHWNCVVATLDNAPDNGLGDALEQLEFRGSTGRLDEARAAYAEAAERYAKLGNEAGQATVDSRLAYLAALDGATADSVDLATRAQRGFERSGRTLDAVTARTHRALAALVDGQLTADVVAAESVVDAARETIGAGPALGLGLLYVRLGRYWAGQHQEPERAMAAFDTAESVLAGLAEPQRRAQALVDLGQVAASVGDVAAAHVAVMAAMAADPRQLDEPAVPTDSRRTGRAVLAGRLYNLASEIRDRQAMDQAARLIRDTVEPLRAHLDSFTGSDRMVAEQLLSLTDLPGQGVVDLIYRAREAREAGDDAGAAALSAQAGAVLDSIPADQRAYDEAIVLAFEGDEAGASAAFERYVQGQLAGLDAAPKSELTRQGRRMLHFQGLVFQLNLGVTTRARAHYDALAGSGSRWWLGIDEEWRALYASARLAEQEDDLDSALSFVDQAISQVEQIRGALRRDELKASLFTGRDMEEIFRDAAKVALRLREAAVTSGDQSAVDRWSAVAFGYAERGRSRALLDMMTANGGAERSDLPADLVARWRFAGAEASLAQDRLASTAGRDGTPAALVETLRERLAAARHQLQLVEDELRRVDPRFWTAINPQAEVADLPTVAGALPDGTVLLQYAVGRTDLLAWAVTRAGMVHAHRRSGVNRIEPLTNQVVSACATPGRYVDQATSLAQLLLVPFRDVVTRGARIVIVPGGPTVRLPFALLPWDDAPFGQAVALSVAPSASTLRAPADRPAADGHPLVVGDPANMAYAPDEGEPAPQPDLPASGVEAACVSRHLAGSTLLLGPTATKADVTALMPTAPVVHLATHGVLDADAPLGSAVLLSDGASLTAAEMLGLRLNAELVVLSACRTGAGRVVRGEEVLGLGRALLAAGARAVVVTLWAIDDVSAALLMTEFHRRRAEMSTPRALQEAVGYLRGLTSATAGAAYDDIRALAATVGAHALGRFDEQVRDLHAQPANRAPYTHAHHWAPFVLITAS